MLLHKMVNDLKKSKIDVRGGKISKLNEKNYHDNKINNIDNNIRKNLFDSNKIKITPLKFNI